MSSVAVDRQLHQELDVRQQGVSIYLLAALDELHLKLTAKV